jgi:hypothetical protein
MTEPGGISAALGSRVAPMPMTCTAISLLPSDRSPRRTARASMDIGVKMTIERSAMQTVSYYSPRAIESN